MDSHAQSQPYETDDEQAAYHADMLAFQQDALRVIDKARQEPITEDEAALLRWAAGLAH